jgi:hypothetical protein
MIKNIKANTSIAAMVLSICCGQQTQAVELFNVQKAGQATKVSIGGYAKVDVRHVNGDIAYQDYWVANFPGGQPIDTSHTGFNVKESRLNFKVTHGDVSGVVEFDFYGGGGNEVVSNSSNPRLRHFYINYKNWMIGQNWSTFMPLHALPEALDFGGPHVGEVFVRQTQIRYTYGNWQVAIENPETNGDGDVGVPSSAVGVTGDDADPDESIPDIVARYNYDATWGLVSFATLIRKIDQGGLNELGIAYNLAGKITALDKDDFRFQLTAGDAGRYVSAGMSPDIVPQLTNEQMAVESTVAFTLAYRHYWKNTLRSTLFYGAAKTDQLNRKRAHWGLNLIDTISSNFDIGAEIGNYAIDDEGIEPIESTYLQFSAKYSF